MTYIAPETGREANVAFMTPRSAEDLKRRREAHIKWAEITRGFVGRSPDHVPSTIAAMAAHRRIFDEQSTQFGDNITRHVLSADGRSVVDSSTLADGFSDPLPLLEEAQATLQPQLDAALEQ